MPAQALAIELAWAAGLFDGEGNVTTSYKKRARAIQVSSADRDMLERFDVAVGAGGLIYRRKQTYSPKTGAPHKVQFVWRARGWLHQKKVATLLLPLVCERRRRALQAFLDHPPTYWHGSTQGLAPGNTCHRGHPLETPADVYVYPNGTAQCRVCRRENWATSRQRAKARS